MDRRRRTLPHKIEFCIDDGAYDLDLYWYDTRLQTHQITSADGVEFSGYDQNIIEFDGLRILPKSVGKTNVRVTYDGCSVEFKVYVRESGFPFNKIDPAISAFRPVQENMVVYKDEAYGARHRQQIRGYVIFEDETMGGGLQRQNLPASGLSRDGACGNLRDGARGCGYFYSPCDRKGIIMPKKAGSTTVTVTITGGHSFTVNVTVLDEPQEGAEGQIDFTL